jgi:NAD(P)-dependent dehydrogenase (short-subunit alcohol dehydrogenase family)
MLKEFDLTGKAAIVMGGGRGIGKGIALTLAEAGADVLAVARTESEVLQTAEEVQRLGVKGLGLRADATNAEEVNQVVEAALSHWGRIDILVNSAGGALVRKPLVPLPAASPPWAKDLQDFNTITTEDEWNSMMDANLLCTFLATRAVGPHMIEQRKGKVINISSMTGAKGYPYHVLYCVTKAGGMMFTQSLALEWAPYHVNVNAIAPGYLATQMTDIYMQDEPMTRRFVGAIPLGRLCEPREVGLLAVYLASEASDYMTGQTIFLDGGMTA